MGDFYQILERVENNPEQAVLATIIDVKGSSYRRVGTSMLMVSNGESIGMLSGGCLENDLKARADGWFALNSKEFEKLRNSTFIYDMRSEEENAWGKAAGCNGIITVLVEPVTGILRHQLIQIKHQMDRGLSAITFRMVEEGELKKRAVLFEDGRMIGDVEDFKEYIKERPFSELAEIRANNIYGVFHRVRPRLFIIGAGDDAVPLTELAVKTGWSIVVGDTRAAFCNNKRFPSAICRVGMPRDLLLGITEQDAAVIMTHDFKVDQILLQELVNKELNYLGVLGPRERTKRLLKGGTIPEKVHAPVGLPIGSEGPEEIAVSIMAEIIQVYRHSIERKGVINGC